MHAFAAGLVMLVGWLGPQPGGPGPGRVAVVHTAGDERLETRLEAELRAQGFEVVDVAPEPDGAEPMRALEHALATTGARAALRMEAAPDAIRVWIVNGVTGKQMYRQVAPEDRERLDRAIVALWAVELLRASAFAPERVVAAAPPALPPPAVGVALTVAPTAVLSPGGLGASYDVAIGARWQRGARGGLEALLLVPAIPAHLTGTGGAALLSIGILGLGAYATTGGARARWTAQAAAGAALAVVRATGDAVDGYEGRTALAASGGPYLRAGGALRASGWLRLRADAVGGAMFPRPVVAFDQARLASWGRPWVALLAGAEATF